MDENRWEKVATQFIDRQISTERKFKNYKFRK